MLSENLFFFQTLQGKSRELKEVENACEVVRRNVDKLNQELKSKMEDLENKKSHLTEVESRIQLSLRFDHESIVTRPQALLKKGQP